jgi:hypothetical protein
MQTFEEKYPLLTRRLKEGYPTESPFPGTQSLIEDMLHDVEHRLKTGNKGMTYTAEDFLNILWESFP